MTRKTIIKELENYLNSTYIFRLDCHSTRKKDLVLCLVIADIFREVELKENEEVVADLLTKLVTICFKSEK